MDIGRLMLSSPGFVCDVVGEYMRETRLQDKSHLVRACPPSNLKIEMRWIIIDSMSNIFGRLSLSCRGTGWDWRVVEGLLTLR